MKFRILLLVFLVSSLFVSVAAGDTINKVASSTGGTHGLSVYNDNFRGQTFNFTASHNYTLYNITLDCYKFGSPGDINITLYGTNFDGSVYTPNATVYSTGVLNEEDIPSSVNWVNVSMSSYKLVYGRNYAIVLTADESKTDFDNRLRWYYTSSTNPYSGGNFISTSDAGENWVGVSGHDYNFKVWGINYDSVVSDCNLTDNETIYSNNFNFSCFIGDIDSSFNYSIECSNGQNVSNSNMDNDTYFLNLTSLVDGSYMIYINVTDGLNVVNRTISFNVSSSFDWDSLEDWLEEHGYIKRSDIMEISLLLDSTLVFLIFLIISVFIVFYGKNDLLVGGGVMLNLLNGIYLFNYSDVFSMAPFVGIMFIALVTAVGLGRIFVTDKKKV